MESVVDFLSLIYWILQYVSLSLSRSLAFFFPFLCRFWCVLQFGCDPIFRNKYANNDGYIGIKSNGFINAFWPGEWIEQRQTNWYWQLRSIFSHRQQKIRMKWKQAVMCCLLWNTIASPHSVGIQINRHFSFVLVCMRNGSKCVFVMIHFVSYRSGLSLVIGSTVFVRAWITRQFRCLFLCACAQRMRLFFYTWFAK